MPPTRSRVTVPAVAATLLFALGGLAFPVAAADSPEAAVNELFDAVEAGQFEAIETLVCEAERTAVREMLDPSATMGMVSDELAEALTFMIEDRGVEILDDDGETATALLTGTMSMNVAEDKIEQVAMEVLVADMGDELSQEDVAWLLPIIEMTLSQSIPLDQELSLVVEDGSWTVCGGLGEPVEEPDYGNEPSVSTEGACSLASPEELTALGALTYDSSSGFETFCTYSTSDWESYHQTAVSIELDQDAGRIAEAYGADQELQVGGAQAWAPGPDDFGTNLIVQAGADILVVNVAAPEGFDWLSQATAVAELIVPRLPDARADLAGPTPEPIPEPVPEDPLCPDLSLDELNELTGLGLDEFTSDAYSCQLISADGDPGFHFILAVRNEVDLETYGLFLDTHEEGTVAGLPALISERQLAIELPGGTQVLDVSVSLDTGDQSLAVTEEEVAVLVAERVLANLVE